MQSSVSIRDQKDQRSRVRKVKQEVRVQYGNASRRGDHHERDSNLGDRKKPWRPTAGYLRIQERLEEMSNTADDHLQVSNEFRERLLLSRVLLLLSIIIVLLILF